jgi:hypothetical protein
MSRLDVDTDAATARGAVRFFWLWLVVGTLASIAGNVTHAILNAPNGITALAAAAAVVPPIVLLGSTHSVALLVKARRSGLAYWSALAMTLALAGCAFVLSFDALTALATSLGMAADRAWLWPCAIDLSIAQSTLALLALTAPTRRRAATPAAVVEPSAESARGPVSPALKDVDRAEAVPSAEEAVPPNAGAVGRWRSTAHELVKSGVTQKDPDVVAQILAQHEAGTPPSTISRRLDVHHTTVNRILARAGERAG